MRKKKVSFNHVNFVKSHMVNPRDPDQGHVLFVAKSLDLTRINILNLMERLDGTQEKLKALLFSPLLQETGTRSLLADLTLTSSQLSQQFERQVVLTELLRNMLPYGVYVEMLKAQDSTGTQK